MLRSAGKNLPSEHTIAERKALPRQVSLSFPGTARYAPLSTSGFIILGQISQRRYARTDPRLAELGVSSRRVRPKGMADSARKRRAGTRTACHYLPPSQNITLCRALKQKSVPAPCRSGPLLSPILTLQDRLAELGCRSGPAWPARVRIREAVTPASTGLTGGPRTAQLLPVGTNAPDTCERQCVDPA